MDNYDFIIDILAEDKDLITYRKSLREVAGSVTATILLQQIIFRSKGKEKFYKFKASCNHAMYKEGDSWIDELGFSIKEFDNAIKRIGTKITQKISRSNILNKTDATGIVLYWTDSDRVTWYQLNRDLLGKLLKRIYQVSDQRAFSKVTKGHLPLVTETTTETTTENMPQGGDGDFSDLFPEPLQADSTVRKLDDNGKAHLLTFGVLPNDKTDPKEHKVRHELSNADWQIHSPDVELAIVYFVLAVRDHHSGFAIPNDDRTRKDWYSSVAGHLKNHPLSELQNLYNLAIIKMIDKNLSYWRPGSLTNWAILEVTNEPILTHQGPQLTDEDKAARDYLDSLAGKPLPD